MAVSTLGILGQSAADLAAQIARYKRAGHITLRTLGEAREQARRHHERAMNYIASVRAELAGMAAIEAQEMDALGRDLAEAAVRNYDDAPGCHVEAPAMGPKFEVRGMDGQGDPFVLDGLPTGLDAPTLNSEVLHSNGHGTFKVTPLPRPAHMEDAEARHAEAIMAAEMDAAVEEMGLADAVAAKVGPPKGDTLAARRAEMDDFNRDCKELARSEREALGKDAFRDDAAVAMADAEVSRRVKRNKKRGAK